MSAIREEVEARFRAARLERDALATETLNTLRAALRNAEIDKRATLSDDDVLAVLRREVKQYREAIDALTASGASEGASEAAAKLEILSPLLPPEMPDAEILSVVDEEIAAMGEEVRTGPLMGRVMRRLSGVSGQRVRALLERRLGRG